MIIPYEKGLVSVIIPTYRRADMLSRAINSAANQTYKNIEILVVDDNEPGDEYSNNVKQLINMLGYNNVTLVKQEKHINGAAARNAGIKRARGEYIAFLDDDDLWLPEKIEKQVRAIKALDDSFGGVSTRKIYFTHGKPTHMSEVWHADKIQNFKIMAKTLNISTCTLLLKHSCLDETGYFDERLKRHQEIQLLAFFTEKYKIALVNEVLTIIDNSDYSNRPSADLLLKYKNDYFNSIKPVLSKYREHKRRLIFAHNMTEVAWLYYRDGNKVKGIKMLFKCIKFPTVLFSFCNRVIGKFKSKKAVKLYDDKRIQYIIDYINQTSTDKDISSI